MKILINSVNLKVGGGLTVALNFLYQIKSDEKYADTQLLVVAPRNFGYESYESKRIKIYYVSSFFSTPLFRFFFDFVFFGKIIRQFAPDVVFTMGNFPVPTSCKQAVIVMFPYAIYPAEAYVWKLLPYLTYLDFRARNMIFRQRLKYTQLLFPQTVVSEQRLNYYYPKIRHTKVIPMAFSAINTNKTNIQNALLPKKQLDIKYLLCLTRYYPHKNIEILLIVASLIKQRNLPYCIVTTIDKEQEKRAKQFVDRIKKYNLENIIINLGTVRIDEVPNLYHYTDGLLLPTLLESFSATYADALHFRKPIFTSDRDFARDICENTCFYFDPMNAEDILKQIQYGFENPHILAEKVRKGYLRSLSYPNWSQVANMYMIELANLVKSQ